jgi:hypothetical protein
MGTDETILPFTGHHYIIVACRGCQCVCEAAYDLRPYYPRKERGEITTPHSQSADCVEADGDPVLGGR